jgi:hypothetical protein
VLVGGAHTGLKDSLCGVFSPFADMGILCRRVAFCSTLLLFNEQVLM